MAFSGAGRSEPRGGADEEGAASLRSRRTKILAATLTLSGAVFVLAWQAARLFLAPCQEAIPESGGQIGGVTVFLAGLAVSLALGAIGGGMLARTIQRPIREMASALDDLALDGHLGPILLPDRDRETVALRESLNGLLASLAASTPEPTASERGGQGGLNRVDVFGEREGDASGEGTETGYGAAQSAQALEAAPRTDIPGGADGLNERQRLGLDFALSNGTMSRAQYQEAVGRNVPARTAQYDLREMVERGFLRMTGKGPATRYLPSEDASRKA